MSAKQQNALVAEWFQRHAPEEITGGGAGDVAVRYLTRTKALIEAAKKWRNTVQEVAGNKADHDTNTALCDAVDKFAKIAEGE
jgi:hypothetical protein